MDLHHNDYTYVCVCVYIYSHIDNTIQDHDDEGGGTYALGIYNKNNTQSLGANTRDQVFTVR